MTTQTVTLKSLPHVETFRIIYDGEVSSYKDVDPIVAGKNRLSFFASYRDLFTEYGEELTPFEYLTRLVSAMPEEVHKKALIKGKNLLPTAPVTTEQHTDSIDEPDEENPNPTPKMGWRERLGAKLGPKDTNKQKEEVA